MQLLCPQVGSQVDVISVTCANYGRTNEWTCPHTHVSDTFCYTSNALNIVRHHCHGETSCDILASNNIFGDPCYGTYKYLDVKYDCVQKGKKGST